MALWRVLPVLAAVVLYCCTVTVHGQSYVPEPVPFNRCPPGQRLLSIGSSDASNITLFSDGANLIPRTGGYVAITPITLHDQRAFGVTLYQMALALNDNRFLQDELGQPARVRLGIYLYQEPENNTEWFDLAVLIAQTDLITLYPSRPQVMYADLLQPVTLVSENIYGLAIYTDAPLNMTAGDWNTGRMAWGQFRGDWSWGNTQPYSDYSSPQGIEMLYEDKRRPISATGCLDESPFKQPGTTLYAFCAMVETYRREPANNTDIQVTSLTNVTRYSGVIVVQSNVTVKTSYGVGYPIVYMEGEVQISTNAGALVYPPLGLRATPFFYMSPSNSIFPSASNILYPSMAIPIDANGILIATARNQTNLFYTNASVDIVIGQRGIAGLVATYFSSFDIFPAAEREDVITQCNVPPGYDYYPTNFQCAPDAAPVAFGDNDLNDEDPDESRPSDDTLPPNLISFRYFTAWTPNTTVYQISFFTFADPVAIIHLRMGLFSTNNSFVDSTSAEPQYTLMEQTEEIELVNVANTQIIANLRTPQKLVQNSSYAIGVWSDTALFGPQAQFGINAAGAPLVYNTVDIDGTFPKQVQALGGQTGTFPVAAIGCVAKERLIAFQWCASFAHHFKVYVERRDGFVWFIDRRTYSGTFWALSTPYKNAWGTYHILVAGNGTYSEDVYMIDPPPPAPDGTDPDPMGNFGQTNSGTWNMNNFQTQTQDWLYVDSPTGLMFDTNGVQIIIHSELNEYIEVYSLILNSVKERGSPVYKYQEVGQYNGGSSVNFTLGPQSDSASCPLPDEDVAWDFVYLGAQQNTYAFETVCNGMAMVQSTYGNNRIGDYARNAEGHLLRAGIVYGINFTAYAGGFLNQISIDLLNNTHLDKWVFGYLGIYDPSGQLIAQAVPLLVLEPEDTMVVSELETLYLPQSGLYYAAIVFDHDVYVAQGADGTGLAMKYAGIGLPDTFVPVGVSAAVPLAIYGCITASHYFCGSFQYYQGDNYSPLAVDYHYSGLLLAQGPNGTNDKGTWQSVLYGVGYQTRYARVARTADNYVTSWTDMLLTRPGNASTNYIYTSGNGGATLDGVGLSFLTSDDYGGRVTFTYDPTSGVYVDSTDAQLGAQLLVNFTIAPVNFSLGLPQCSFLYLQQDIEPLSSLANSSVCPAGNQAVVWGDANRDDFFYIEEGLVPNLYTDITLTPFSTGPTYSNITQLSISLGMNANMFAHMRMALYFGKALDLLAESNELVVDNVQDVTLYFTLNQTVTLYPASQYYIAMWTDVTLFTAAGWDYSAFCYTGVTYGYDLQAWPARIGSVEADYYLCHPLPVAALGCAVATGPPYVPPIDPDCPPLNSTEPAYSERESRYSTSSLLISVLLTAIVCVLATALVGWLVVTGKCTRFFSGAVTSGRRRDVSDSAILVGDSDTNYNSL